VQPKVRPNAANSGPVTVGAFQILWNTQGDAAPDAELAVNVPSFSPAGGAGGAGGIGGLRGGGAGEPHAGDRAGWEQGEAAAAVGQASVVEYRVPRAQLAGLDRMPYTYDSEGQGEEGARNLGISANAVGDVMDPAAWAGFDYRPSACNRPPECLSAAPSVATL